MLRAVLLGVAAAAAASLAAPAAKGPPSLTLERTIALAGVRGRIDHLAFDAGRRRLFVAELGNGSVEALDLATGRSLGRINGLREPQGLGYLPETDELVVATGGDGVLRFYRGADLTLVGAIRLGDDADNVRVDRPGRRLVVGYGAGALAVIDATTRRVVRRIPLPAHPEAFQLEAGRAYVNLPDAGRTAVVEVETGRELQSWPNGLAKFNFPLALPGRDEVAVVFRFPSLLAIADGASGARRQALPTCGDADDLLVDRARGRLYVTCGAGAVDVFQHAPAGYRRLARVASRRGARTGLFVPELDRLFVAARDTAGQGAAILVFRPA